MKRTRALHLATAFLMLTGCVTAPPVKDDVGMAFPTPVSADKAFDAAIAAGADLGFKPMRGPAPDREKGFVPLYGGTSAATETAKRLMPLLALGTTEYILYVRLRKDGATASGADFEVQRTGAGEFTQEQKDTIQSLLSGYKEAFKRRLYE